MFLFNEQIGLHPLLYIPAKCHSAVYAANTAAFKTPEGGCLGLTPLAAGHVLPASNSHGYLRIARTLTGDKTERVYSFRPTIILNTFIYLYILSVSYIS